jgi:hypothetical protein
MSKNLTRKGLALGAIVALGSTFFSGAAAHAAGLADTSFVSLAPTTGTEYSVLSGQNFSLSANSATAATATGANLKFLVADSAAASSVVTSGTTGSAFATPTFSTTTSAVALTGVVTVFTATANGLHTGDIVNVSGITDDTGSAGTGATLTTNKAADLLLLNKTGAVVTVTDSTHFTYTVTAATLTGDITATVGGTANYVRGARSTSDNSFVYSSHSDQNLADRTLVLSATTTSSVSVDVTAWVDSNNNDKIDSTEYVSPTRTVKFLKNADITPTVTLAPVSAGDSSLTAYITTVPALNGQQVGDKLGAVFTRQDSTDSLAVLGVSAYNDTTKTWTITKSLSTASTDSYAYGSTAATGWTGLTRATGAPPSSIVVASNVATVTVSNTNNLKVGDKITFGASGTANATLATNQYTVASVPSATTFTFAVTVADGTLAPATSGNNTYTITTYGSANSVVDRAYAGTYSAQAAIATGSNAGTLVKFGSAVTNGAVAKTTSAVAVDVVASTTVGRTSTSGATVLKSNTDATVVATVTDKTGAPVAVGTPVVATLISESAVGTPTVNGSVQTAVVASTDANGQAKFVVHNASAVAGEQVVLAITAEGVAPTSPNYTLTWSAAKYSIVGLADATSTLVRDRSAVAAGSYTFDLLVEDQFKNAAPTGIRLLETLSARSGSTVAPVVLTAGKASVTVADSGLNTDDTTVIFEVQSNATGSWVTDVTAYNWGGTTALHLSPVVIHWNAATAKDAVVLNADAASTPNGNNAAALTASTTTTALTAVDLRTTATNAAYISAAGKAVVSGLAKNSVTGAGDKGAVVTATAAGVLFNVGDVWSIGSISFLADASGYFAINAYSSVPGAVKIAVVAGNSAAASATVTYSGAAAADAAIIKATAGATTIQAGRAVDYTVLVTDKNGLLVKGFVVKATVAGAGSFAGTAAADGSVSVTTDATGKATVKVLYSSNDAGTATVTFADPTTGTTIAAAAVSTEVGSTDANIDIVNNRVTAVASFSKGKTVSFYVDGYKKWSKASASDADVVLNYNLKKGTHTVTVKISGGFVTTEKFIVK